MQRERITSIMVSKPKPISYEHKEYDFFEEFFKFVTGNFHTLFARSIFQLKWIPHHTFHRNGCSPATIEYFFDKQKENAPQAYYLKLYTQNVHSFDFFFLLTLA